MPLLALDIYLLLYFPHYGDNIFIDVDFVWFNGISANFYDISLMLNSVCDKLHVSIFFP
jgi:hypothetical protein